MNEPPQELLFNSFCISCALILTPNLFLYQVFLFCLHFKGLIVFIFPIRVREYLYINKEETVLKFVDNYDKNRPLSALSHPISIFHH